MGKRVRVTVTLWALRDKTALCRIRSTPNHNTRAGPKASHLRETLFDDLQGGSHAVPAIQYYISIMAHQVFRKSRVGNEKVERCPGPEPNLPSLPSLSLPPRQ